MQPISKNYIYSNLGSKSHQVLLRTFHIYAIFFSRLSQMIPRMKRALSEPIEFEVSESTELDCDNFEVLGSTGKSYKVSINRGSKSQCSCMDYKNRGKICKHIIAILMKHYLLNINQIRELDRNSYLGLDDVANTRSSVGDMNEECPICFQNLERIEWVCERCTKGFHMNCISEWFNILRAQRMNASCPMCRHNV